MKAIIVDDEEPVRVAIKSLVNWEEYEIDTLFEAENGNEAQEIINNEHPEIIFTDIMMPYMDGKELMVWINENSPESKTIVISGYDDFDYVRHFLRYGSIDYILKPIGIDDVKNAVDKAVSAWKTDEEKRKRDMKVGIKLNELKNIYWDKVFSDIIKEHSSYNSKIKEIMTSFEIKKEINEAMLVMINFNTIDISKISSFDGEEELFFFMLNNICNEILKNEECGYSFRYLNSQKEILILLWDKFSNVDDLLQKINIEFYKIISRRFDFGVSRIKKFPKYISEAYEEAKEADLSRNVLPSSNIRINKFNSLSKYQPNLSFQNYEEEIKFSIISGNTKKLNEIVRNIADAIKTQDVVTLNDLEFLCQEYKLMLSRWTKEFFNEEELELSFLYNKEYMPIIINEDGKLSFKDLQQELLSGFVKLSEVLMSYPKKENRVIFEIAKYLKANYAKEISLQDIADKFFLSREYISRRFKQEIGENLSDYVCRIRIEKAKMLLFNPNMKIKEISQLVGYEDEKYFCKVFKKIIGVSPNEFRNSNKNSTLN